MENALAGGGGTDLESVMRIDGDVATVDPAGAVRAFYHDCSEEVARDAVARLRPQSVAAFGGRVREVAWRTKPSTFVVCTDDRALPVALQRSSAARTGTVIDMHASHSPFLSRPRELAGILDGLAR